MSTRYAAALCAIAALLLAGGPTAFTVQAQPAVSGRPRATTSATAVVGFLWSHTSAPAAVIPRPRARCAPAECFSQFVSVRANARWQLEAKLASPPSGFTIDLSQPAIPATPVLRLTAATWVPVYVTGQATRGQTAEVTYVGARTTGSTGRVPTATEVTALVQYRVVSLP